jgi:nucleoside 2-deoxyribosyltransferase
MDPENPDLVDILDAIKEGARRCGIDAERVDEPQYNDRITDRMLESIRKAQFVIADLTLSKPNVFWEAGYAHGIGKTPIYVARHDTRLEFDLKDYPVIFFKNMKELKDGIERRLRGLEEGRKKKDPKR